jgi:hypothetical protein
VDLNGCATAFSAASTSLASACPTLASNNTELTALGQESCINGTSVFLSTVLPNCTASASKNNGKRAVRGRLTQALACNSTVGSAFASFVSACNATFDIDGNIFIPALSAGCTAAEQAAVDSMTKSCPPTNASANNASTLLGAASSSGGFAGAIDAAATRLANKTASAKAVAAPSTDNCTASLFIATSLTSELASACTLQPPQADLAALAKQACDNETAAVVDTFTPACASVAKNVKGSVSAPGQPSCSHASQTAFNALEGACPFLERRNGNSTDCQAAQITAIGILSSACPASK